MKEIHIGMIIKQRRIELGLTQEELGEGICEPPTMSRIEKGRQTPSHSKLKALLQRLGLPSEKYYAMMSENELEIERIKDEIIDYNTRGMQSECLEKIQILENLTENDDHITKQFIIRSKALAGKVSNEKWVPYSPREKLDLLFQAIKITIPNFDIDEIGRHWYSLDEVKVINQLGIVYSESKQHLQSIDIYYQLFKYISKKLSIHADNVATCILVSYNYSLVLLAEKRYEEASNVANWGWNKCIEWSRAGNLGGLLFVIGKCLYCTGKIDESKDYFIQAYYAYRSMRNIADMNAVAIDIKEYFDIEL